MIYEWKYQPIKGLSAQTVGEELDRIYTERGEISAEAVVEAATPVSSPIHNVFEWDDTAAAIKYRKHQARMLICAVVKAPENNEPDVRAFVNVRSGYHPITVVMRNDEMRDLLLCEARKELDSFRVRYSHFVEFAGVIRAIEEMD